ncbi:acetolactate synthase [Rhodotorula toruloides]|uniref:Acetolactate synthase n=1 Tax=Rhodotorula toruloides TaxID=5286 RepID=A0A511KNQ4_RHOTO|nr:acetolactate synthase [Rhodotorula toruloides]
MSSPSPVEVYTTSNVFLDALVEAGIKRAFVNLGSDHPALLEAFAHRKKYGLDSLEIMVGLSAAQGYAQVTGKPAAVIVHVDCGTQALAGAVHNVSTCRTPVLIYAGASPYTQDGELAGSRNEFIHWLQNAVDQPQILRQYMRHVGEIRSGKNTKQVVNRALQFAKSEPMGPVYVWGQREATEEHIDSSSVPKVRKDVWSPVELSPLNESSVKRIADALLRAKKPLIITSYLGRNPLAVDALTKFVDLTAIPVFQPTLSTVNLPFDHPSHVGVAFGGRWEVVEEADCILIIDSDVPWIPLHTKPREDAEVFHLDVDPLKERMAFAAYPALLRAKVDAATALSQLHSYISSSSSFSASKSAIDARRAELVAKHQAATKGLLKLEELPKDDVMTSSFIVGAYRRIAEEAQVKSLVCNEAISNVWNHIIPKRANSLISSGASSLGWALGAAIGASQGSHDFPSPSSESDLVTVFVGDGSYIFGVPSAAFWMARRYETPFLTVVFNNGGWKSPKLSLLGVHPTGLGATGQTSDLNVTFGPSDSLNPDYGAIAAAAGGAWFEKVKKASALEGVLREAIRVVREEKRCAVVDCWLTRF